MLADLWVEYGQQSLELIHLDLENLELVDENLFEPVLHQVFKDSVGVLLVFGLDVDVACKVVHSLTVRYFCVEVGIGPQQRVQNCRV
jgi:hypothetical protein